MKIQVKVLYREKWNENNVIYKCNIQYRVFSLLIFYTLYLSIFVTCDKGTSVNPNSLNDFCGAGSMMPTEKYTLLRGQSTTCLTGGDGVKTSMCSWTMWTSGSHRENN